MFLGSAETDTENYNLKQNRQSRIVKYYGFTTTYLNNAFNIFNNLINGRHHHSHNKLIIWMRKVENALDRLLVSFNKSKKYRHRLCAHRYNCITYPIIGFIQRFLVGYSLQFVIKCLGSLSTIIKKPKLLWRLFTSSTNYQLGMFFGGYVFIFRVIYNLSLLLFL